MHDIFKSSFSIVSGGKKMEGVGAGEGFNPQFVSELASIDLLS